jgi:Uma2 family endonuclease
MNPQLLDKSAQQPTEEKLVTLYGIDWEKFKAIEAQLQDNRDVRLFYLSGVLEILSPIGEERGYIKSTLDLLLEAYMREKVIACFLSAFSQKK